MTLRSADPRDPPTVNFHYFEEGSDAAGRRPRRRRRGREVRAPHDRAAEGASGLIAEEELPGDGVESDAELADSCAPRLGAPCLVQLRDRRRGEQGGVLDGDFRVHGTHGLRVVDASVFPRIPGFFIASAVYMVGEKAADAILPMRRSASRRAGLRPRASGGD